MIVDKILPLLSNVKQTGAHSWTACCPVHDDKHPSFCITEKDDSVLMHCFSCHASIDEIVDALGLTIADLYPDNPESNYSPQRRKHFPARDVLNALANEVLVMEIITNQFAQDKTITEEDRKRVKQISQRFEVAKEYVQY